MAISLEKLRFRRAESSDVTRIVELLAEDVVGREEHADDGWTSEAAFAALSAQTDNFFVVAEHADDIVGCYQLTLIASLSPRIPLRAQVECVRVAAEQRGQAIGTMMMQDAEARARDAGAVLMQLTTNVARGDAHRFYAAQGYEQTHLGFKRWLI